MTTAMKVSSLGTVKASGVFSSGVAGGVGKDAVLGMGVILVPLMTEVVLSARKSESSSEEVMLV